MGFVYRAHEWLADHVKYVQYPNVRGPRRSFWKHEMPWEYRFFIIAVSLIAIPVLLSMLVVMAIVIWAFIA